MPQKDPKETQIKRDPKAQSIGSIILFFVLQASKGKETVVGIENFQSRV